jgi:tRNA (Thr-GGU) A37 N-methylase
MMNRSYQINAIGQVMHTHGKSAIKLDSNYLPGLTQMEGFSHLQIIWWAHSTDGLQHRKTLIASLEMHGHITL